MLTVSTSLWDPSALMLISLNFRNVRWTRRRASNMRLSNWIIRFWRTITKIGHMSFSSSWARPTISANFRIFLLSKGSKPFNLGHNTKSCPSMNCLSGKHLKSKILQWLRASSGLSRSDLTQNYSIKRRCEYKPKILSLFSFIESRVFSDIRWLIVSALWGSQTNKLNRF